MPSLADPLFLALLPLPLIASWLIPPAIASSGAMRVPDSIARQFGLGRGFGAAGAEAMRRTLPWAIWFALVLALAGPQRIALVETLPASGRDIILVLDLSGSMEREDFSLDGETASRLAVVQRVGSAFLRGRQGDRVGLVIFAEEAYVAAALTHDTEAVARLVETAAIGIAGRSTGISSGLGLALRRLDESDAASKVVILLSDGIDTASAVRPRDAAGLARRLGVRVHTIALGPRDTSDGGDQRNVVDAETLNAVAEISGGEAFRVRNTEDLVRIAASIDRLEGSATTLPPGEVRRELWPWPATLALVLLGLQIVLPGVRR